jgi:hypothetical protein
MIHHGGGLHVVRERRGVATYSLADYTVFDDRGRMPHEKAIYNQKTGHVEFRNDRQVFAELALQRLALPIALPYDRYFGCANKAEQPPDELLRELGAAMRFDEGPSVESDIPSAYTYLGQFVFHDLSYMARGDSETDPVNQRSAALDLDSLYDDPPAFLTLAPCASQATTALPIGCTVGGEPLDLPRTNTGEPYIGDQRNDDNLALAQTHMALIRFANAVAAAIGDQAEAKRQTQLHLQSVVLRDYLARIIDCTVYNDVMQNGRAVIYPSCEGRDLTESFLLPLEFAAACGRFGHSMVRNEYKWNVNHPNVSVRALWENTYSSYEPPIIRLATNWPSNWRRLLAVNLNQQDVPIRAARIGTRFARILKEIRPVALPDPEPPDAPREPNLAIRSLLRGRLLELASGQEVANRILDTLAAKGRPGFAPLDCSEVVANEDTTVCEIMNRTGSGTFASLASNTPLWFYVLKEAEVRCAGMRLGPLGSRIVMETIHAAIGAACPSILRSDGKLAWAPDPRLSPTHANKYTYIDLIAFGGLL